MAWHRQCQGKGRCFPPYARMSIRSRGTISGMARYRLYVDESGDHTYSFGHNPDTKYLGLTGVLLEDEYYRTTFHPQFESLKQRHFPHNPDEPLVLVRKHIINRKGKFGVLADPEKNSRWEKDFLEFLSNTQATIFAVVIDKERHLSAYGEAAYHPYHYSMNVMLQRLREHLHRHGGFADVMAESRGKTEDKELKNEYRSVWRDGTRYISGQEFQRVLTSNDLKIRKKESNTTGLQVADLIAAPSKMNIIISNNRPLMNQPSRFTRDINSHIRRNFNSCSQVFLG